MSETRRPDEGHLEGGYTFYRRGKCIDEQREAGVGFAISTKFLRKCQCDPIGVSERLMKFRLPVGKDDIAAISAYAPTLSSSDQDKQAFYESLD